MTPFEKALDELKGQYLPEWSFWSGADCKLHVEYSDKIMQRFGTMSPDEMWLLRSLVFGKLCTSCISPPAKDYW